MLKLFKYIRPYTFSIGVVFLLVFLQVLADLYLPTLMSDIVDIGIVRGDIGFIERTGGIMLLAAAGGSVCAVLASFTAAKTAMAFGKILRGLVFSKVESFSLHEFDRFGTATLITRTTNDITQVQMVVFLLLRLMTMAPLIGIGGIIMAVSKDRALSLILVIVLPVLAAIIYLIMKKSLPLFRVMQEKLDKLNLVLREGLTGIRVIKAFNRIGRELERFDEANLDLTATAVRVNIIIAFMMPLMMLVMNFTVIAIIWFGGIRINNGAMQVGALMAFIQYAMQIMFSLIMISFLFIMVPRAQASAVRIGEVIDVAPEIKDPEVAKEAFPEKGYVEFQDVSFTYPGAEQPALCNISFKANPGETTAIIGSTGSGKSTLINLIPRFYDVDQGRVLIDGVDVREMRQAALRTRIAYVPQNSILFGGSISDNIRFGKQEASDNEIKQAAITAQAFEFIDSLKNGFDHLIAQGGANVSGGQKQRLSIARALVRQPKIYMFDDSLSALDFTTDLSLRKALKRETQYATVFIVAQRVGSVMDADRIIVLDEGRIAGMGTHQELLQSCLVYREIVYSQLSEEDMA